MVVECDRVSAGLAALVEITALGMDAQAVPGRRQFRVEPERLAEGSFRLIELAFLQLRHATGVLGRACARTARGGSRAPFLARSELRLRHARRGSRLIVPSGETENVAEDLVGVGNLRGQSDGTPAECFGLSRGQPGSFNSQRDHARFMRVSGLCGSMRGPPEAPRLPRPAGQSRECVSQVDVSRGQPWREPDCLSTRSLGVGKPTFGIGE